MFYLVSCFILMYEISSVGDYFFNLSQYRRALGLYNLVYRETPNTEINQKQNLCLIRLNEQINYDKYEEGFLAYKSGDNILAKEMFAQIKDYYSLGVISCAQGLFLDGEKYFERANDLYAKGVCSYKSGDYESAINYFSQTRDATDACLFMAESYYSMGKLKNAEKYYYESLKDTELTYDALYGLAWTHYRVGEFLLSAEEFAEFSVRYVGDSLSPKSLYFAARAFSQADSIDESIRYFCKLRDEHPQFELMESTYYWLGKLYYKASDFSESIEALNALTTAYPKTKFMPEAYLLIGNSYYKVEKYDSAIKFYSKIERPDWYVDEARFRLEESYFKLGKYKLFVDVLSNFIRKYPNSPRAPSLGIEIARYWVKRDRFSDAIAAYNRVIQEFGWSNVVNDAKYGLAECYIRINKPSNAIEIFRELLKTSLQQKAQLSIANICFTLGNYNDAINEYAVLINKYPSSMEAREARYKIGLTYEILQKPAEARKLFNEFIDDYPEDSRRWDIKLKIAKTFWNEGLTESYRKTLLEIENSGTKEASREAAMMLGVLYFEKSDFKTSKIFYIKALEEYEDSDSKARSLLGAAKCSELLAQNDEAVSLYQEVIKLSPNPSFEQEAKERLKKLSVLDKKSKKGD